MDLHSQIQDLNESVEDLAKAVSIREKVSLANRAFEILSLIEGFIASELSINGHKPMLQEESTAVTERKGRKSQAPEGREFRGLTLAEIGKLLLQEHGTLHGLEIEKRAKAGGFKTNAKHFQSYLAVAFKRAGGFENIGKNTWRLNPAIQPIRDERKPKKVFPNELFQ